MFFEKSTVCAENNFSPVDLLNFVSSLIRSSKIQERRFDRSNYSWLSSRNIGSVEYDLDEYKPLVRKLTPENCAAIAVKLETYSEESTSTSNILTAFRNLLEEQYSIQMMEGTVKRGREKSKRRNKVRPILIPPGRVPTVSFILD